MYECPNCAGNLKFDILAQKLHCGFCGTLVDPYDISKEKDAEEHLDEYEVTIFSCPQCGGEILSEDTTAATFCSFCGSATILDSCVSKERRPARIIPFTKTKEDCKKSYAKMMKSAIYAPKELKDPEHISKFRGIYMPYGVYYMESKGPVEFVGSQSERQGDYIYTQKHKFRCEVDQCYEGLTFDLSSSFADSLSSAIAPYDMQESKDFTPTFLSGFYADTSDVDQKTYEIDAQCIVIEDCAKQLKEAPDCKKYELDGYGLIDAARPKKTTSVLAMLPVWFLAYRKGDRISYAVVNGQTGKAAADIPIDWKKYLFGSVLVSLPIFLLLNLLFTFKPNIILMIAMCLALFCVWISNMQISRLEAKRFGEDDKGVMSKRVDPKTLEDHILNGMIQPEKVGASLSTKVAEIGSIFFMGLLIYRYLLGFVSLGLALIGQDNMVDSAVTFLTVALVVVIIYLSYRIMTGSMKKKKKIHYSGNWKQKMPTLIKPLAGALLAIIVLVVNPVADWIYYVAVIFCMGMVLWAIRDIFKHHNELTTRKLPQFNKRGGDVYA